MNFQTLISTKKISNQDALRAFSEAFNFTRHLWFIILIFHHMIKMTSADEGDEVKRSGKRRLTVAFLRNSILTHSVPKTCKSVHMFSYDKQVSCTTEKKQQLSIKKPINNMSSFTEALKLLDMLSNVWTKQHNHSRFTSKNHSNPRTTRMSRRWGSLSHHGDLVGLFAGSNP